MLYIACNAAVLYTANLKSGFTGTAGAVEVRQEGQWMWYVVALKSESLLRGKRTGEKPSVSS